MKQQTLLSPTLRDIPADAEVKSHQLMLRAGLIRQTASGIYSYLPQAVKVLQKIQEIVREEMNAAGAQELLMPAVQPAELWEESGRLDDYGPELMRLLDRHERRFVLGPTHEEVVTSLIRDGVNSYKRLPMTVYQIQTKYRDERRPRFGLLRGREFIMKDAYSFSTTEAELEETYQDMFAAYTRIFKRCGLDFRAVEADSGAIGGTGTHEFMALSDVGEDTIAYSDQSEYAANVEIARLPAQGEIPKANSAPLEKQRAKAEFITEAADELEIPLARTIQSQLFFVDEVPVLLLLRGDHQASDVKLANHFGTLQVREATTVEIQEMFNVEPASIGPIGAPKEVRVVADQALQSVIDGICAANEKKQVYINVDHRRDFELEAFIDARLIQEGDPSPDGKGTIRFAEGIEIGQVFKLGTKYSEALGANFLDENGKSKPMIMGCYGIGISRTLAAVIEQNHDEDGIIWPKTLAPFDLHLLVLNPKDESQQQLGGRLYDQLRREGYDCLYDDRKERAGVKFKDADLYGLPIRITAGKKAADNIVEVKNRQTGDVKEVEVDQLLDYLKEKF